MKIGTGMTFLEVALSLFPDYVKINWSEQQGEVSHLTFLEKDNP